MRAIVPILKRLSNSETVKAQTVDPEIVPSENCVRKLTFNYHLHLPLELKAKFLSLECTKVVLSTYYISAPSVFLQGSCI